MWTAAALWDVLAKAANLAQMAVMLVAVGTSLLRVLPPSKRECAELERCSRRLRALLEWPTGCGVALLCSEMGGPVVDALGDAARLVDAYHGSTLWRRLWSAGGTAAQLRDMQDVVNSYCGLLLSVNARLLLQQQQQQQQQTAQHHPPSSDTTSTIHEVNDTSQSQRAQAVSNCTTVTGIGSQTGDTDPAGCETSVCISVVHGED